MKNTDSYLLNKYGITLAERTAIVTEQDGKCAACGRPFDGTVRMEVDHEHFKVTATKKGFRNWWATATFADGRIIEVCSKTKTVAMKQVKKAARRASVRGILCGGRYAGCNRKLGRIDKIPWLQSVTQYLQDPPARKVLFREPQ